MVRIGFDEVRSADKIFRDTPLHTGRMLWYNMSRFRDARITQLVECHLAKVVVAGSNPVPRSTNSVNGSIAQLVEQVTLNHWVQGSNPCAPTILTVDRKPVAR